MAEVRVPLKVEDQATPAVDKYIQKMTAAATTTDKVTHAMLASQIQAQKQADVVQRAAGQEESSITSLLSVGKELEKQQRQAAAETKMLQNMAAQSDAALRAAGATEENIRALREWEQQEAQVAADEAMKKHIADTVQAIQAKTSAMGESASQAKGMSEADEKASESTDKLEKKTSRLVSGLKKIGSGAKSAVSGLLGFGKVGTPLDGVVSKLTRMAASLFTVRKLIKYMKDAMERAPDEIASSFTSLGTTIKNDFATVFVTMLKAIQPGIDKLRASLESPGGQRFLKGIARAAEVAGQAIGWMAEMVGVLIEWIGNNWNVIMPVAIGLLGLFAAKMLVAAAAAMAANWPLLLMIGIVTGVIAILTNLGVTAGDVFGFIGGCISVAIAWFQNMAMWVDNVCSGVSAAWGAMTNNMQVFFANFANAVSSMWSSLMAQIVRNLKGIAKFADSIPGSIKISGMLDAIISDEQINAAADALQADADSKWSTFSGDLQDVGAAFEGGYNKNNAFSSGWADKAWAEGEAAGREFGKSLEDFVKGWDPNELDKIQLQDIKATVDDISGAGGLGGIGASVENIEKAVAMSEEDIKHIADIAERRYVNKINLTSQTPVINITGQNTGRMQDDAINLANMIAKVLMEQASASATRATALP